MSREVGLVLGAAYQRMRDMIEEELAAEGLGERIEIGMGPILFTLEANGIMPLHALVERTGYTKGAITNLIRRMVAKGLVVRSDDPQDARVVLVRLAAKGRLVMPSMHAARTRIDERMRRLLGDDHDATARGLAALAGRRPTSDGAVTRR